MHQQTTFSKFIIEQQRRASLHGPELAGLLNDIQTACKFIAMAIFRGTFDAAAAPAPLRQVAHDIMLETYEFGGQLSGFVSDALEDFQPMPAAGVRGRYLLLFDPLDGAPNLDINATAGTIFSVLSAPSGVDEARPEDFLQPGICQVAAGYALYGPVSMMVVTFGTGVQGFTLDRAIGAYMLTHPGIRIAEATREIAVSSSAERFWEPCTRRYVAECLEGAAGARGTDFHVRRITSVVPEIHRILIRGGLFIHPSDRRDPTDPCRLRLLTKANPLAMLIEQAGGAASTGRRRVLEIVPNDIHQHVAMVLGARQEVDRLLRYHETYDRGEPLVFESPLFNTRSLFRAAWT
jgi:fructose-1,6-bisphosphatase